MNRVLILLLVVCFVSCNAIRVNYDYDKETNYSNYTTYNYFSDINTGLSDLDNKRLFKAIDSIMASKGLLLSEEPDFHINIISDAYRNPSNNSVGVGVGGTGRNIGGGVSVGIPLGRPTTGRQIKFDFVDSQKDLLFWQAISESTFRQNASPNDRERVLKKIAAKVLSKYPPKTKNK